MLNVLYAGSPDASAKTLELLLNDSYHALSNDASSEATYRIVGVLTNPPSAQDVTRNLFQQMLRSVQ